MHFLKAPLRLYQGTIHQHHPFLSLCVCVPECYAMPANLSPYAKKLCVVHIAEEAVPSICDVAAAEHYSSNKCHKSLEAEPQSDKIAVNIAEPSEPPKGCIDDLGCPQ